MHTKTASATSECTECIDNPTKYKAPPHKKSPLKYKNTEKCQKSIHAVFLRLGGEIIQTVSAYTSTAPTLHAEVSGRALPW